MGESSFPSHKEMCDKNSEEFRKIFLEILEKSDEKINILKQKCLDYNVPFDWLLFYFEAFSIFGMFGKKQEKFEVPSSVTYDSIIYI